MKHILLSVDHKLSKKGRRSNCGFLKLPYWNHKIRLLREELQVYALLKRVSEYLKPSRSGFQSFPGEQFIWQTQNASKNL